EVQHILVVHADAALGDGSADGPGSVRTMDAVHACAEIERTYAKRVHGMAARHPTGKTRILGNHSRRWRPGRVDSLLRDAGCALPAALLTRRGDWIADRLAWATDVIELAVGEADDDLALGVLRAEADRFAAAAVDRIAPAPVPE